MANFLDKILGNTYSPVNAFVGPQYANQLAEDEKFYAMMGALSGLNKSKQAGLGYFGTGYNVLSNAQEGKRLPSTMLMNNLTKGVGLKKALMDMQNLGYDIEKKRGAEVGRAYLIEQYKGNPRLQAMIGAADDKVIEQIMKATMPAPNYGESLQAKSIGADPTQLTQTEAIKLQQIGQAPTPKEVADLKKDYILADKPNITKGVSMPQTATDLINAVNTRNKMPQGQNLQPNQINAGGGTISYNPPVNLSTPSTELIQPKPGVPEYSYDGDITFTPNQADQQVQANQQVNTQQGYNPQQTPTNAVPTPSQSDAVVPKDFMFSETQKQALAKDRESVTAQSIKTLNTINKTRENIYRLLDHKGAPKFFGRLGQVRATLTDQDAIAAKYIYDQIMAEGTITDLLGMKMDSSNGATPFGQLNGAELNMTRDRYSNAKAAVGWEQAKTALLDMVDGLDQFEENIYGKQQAVYDSFGLERFPEQVELFFDANIGGGKTVKAKLGSLLQGRFYNGKGIDSNAYYIEIPSQNGQSVLYPAQYANGDPITKQSRKRKK